MTKDVSRSDWRVTDLKNSQRSGQVREEGMNGGKPIVARGHGVVPVLLQVIQEAADYIRRQILQCQTRARFAMTLAGELQK